MRIRLYKFYNEHKGKMFTVNHFFSEKVLKRTINNIIKRAENGISARRKLESGRIAKKMNKRALKSFKKDISFKFSRRQLARQFNINQGYVCKLLKKHGILKL